MMDGSDMNPEQPNQGEAMLAYGTGQAAFERGLYREAIAHFQQALTRTQPRSALGGAIQVWLVTAYDAAGQREDALTLCRELGTHPNHDTRQQSRRLLYILEAPKLQTRTEWLTQIPDLNAPAATQRYRAVGQPGRSPQAKPVPPKSITEDPFEPIEPKESSGFLALSIGLSILVLMGLWWFSQTIG